ncbi:MAG TPA: isochorismatase family protein [Caulobacteraceae bacterium]|nr:isochorismatase family protein [Caulobacteraceae bacterium]
MSAPAPVIVIDLQTGMFDGVAEPPIADAERLTQNAREVIAWARGSGRPVAFVRHDGAPGDSLAPGKPGWAVWPALGQVPGEPTFSKSVGDAFSNPALGQWVEAAGASGVILLGAQSEMCVAETVKGALARGLDVTVVADAHGTWPSGGDTAAEIIGRQNEAFAAAGAHVAPMAVLLSKEN